MLAFAIAMAFTPRVDSHEGSSGGAAPMRADDVDSAPGPRASDIANLASWQVSPPETQVALDTALCDAARRSWPESVAWLLARDATCQRVQDKGLSALSLAIIVLPDPADEKLFKSMEDRYGKVGSDAYAREVEDAREATIRALLDRPDEWRHRTEPGFTAMHLAMERRRLDLVLAMVARGADINEPDANGATVLHFAMRYYEGQDLLAKVRDLLAAGARDTQDKRGRWAGDYGDATFAQVTGSDEAGWAALRQARRLVRATRPATETASPPPAGPSQDRPMP
jgi:ankyrin repeat protein